MLDSAMSESSEKMSDHSESGSESGNANDICRDYLRNVCRRGKRCKYRHPGEQETTEFKKISEYTFCHDYQNNGCRRPNCKFLHCSREEEEIARNSGDLPSRVLQAAQLGIGVNHAEMIAKGGVPICKDNLKGECHRGVGCKYRHISSAEYEFLQRKSEGREVFTASNGLNSNSKDPRFERFEFEQDVKRRRLDPEFVPDGFNVRQFEARYAPLSPNAKPLSYQLLEDENGMLRKKVDELKKQVADLTATNEVLLEQNARYRVSKTNILQTLNSAGVQAAIQASSLNHLNSLNTSLAQQIALSTDLSSITQHQQQAAAAQQQVQQAQQVLQQRMVREMSGAGPPGAVQCSLAAAAPQTLNTATLSMNPPSIVPVSLPQTLPAALQPSNTPSPALQSIDMNGSLVSYPIVSQGMRMTSSSLAH